MASGPITKRSEAETKPSIKGPSLEALNFCLRVSPNLSNRVSRESAEPISPPISIAAKITRRVEPFGNESIKFEDHSGMSAEAAPRSVIRPRMSVMRLSDFLVSRLPAPIPNAEPMTIAITLMRVPRPTNIV